MTDFAISESQRETRDKAAAFARDHLKLAYQSHAAPNKEREERLRAADHYVDLAVTNGIVKSLVPEDLGGTGGAGGILGSALVTEELFAVDPQIGLNLVTLSMGLMPLVFSSAPNDLKKKLVKPFLKSKGLPLAVFHWSCLDNATNLLQMGGGDVQTVALAQQADAAHWSVSGENIWPGNRTKWDDKKADLQILLCRNTALRDIGDSAMLVAVPSNVLDHDINKTAVKPQDGSETPGFTVHCGKQLAFKDLRVPDKYVIERGPDAVRIARLVYAATGAMVAAMGAGLLRAAFRYALKFARTGCKDFEKQTALELATSLKTKIDTVRMIGWRAAHAVDNKALDAAELCSQAKTYGSKMAVEGIAEMMKVFGIVSRPDKYPMARLMEEAAALRIFDGGNQHAMQQTMLETSYNPYGDL